MQTTYLSKTKHLKSISIAELNIVLMGLHAAAFNVEDTSGNEFHTPTDHDGLVVGEHIACFWLHDENTYKWYLGVVTEHPSSGSPTGHYIS